MMFWSSRLGELAAAMLARPLPSTSPSLPCRQEQRRCCLCRAFLRGSMDRKLQRQGCMCFPPLGVGAGLWKEAGDSVMQQLV